MVFIEWRTVRNESRVWLLDPAGRRKERANRTDSTGPWKKKNSKAGLKEREREREKERRIGFGENRLFLN